MLSRIIVAAIAVLFVCPQHLSLAQTSRDATKPHPLVEPAIAKIETAIASGPYEANWNSLEGYEIPQWYKDAKFGIFIHWGAHSVPAFGSEWYPRQMYINQPRRG